MENDLLKNVKAVVFDFGNTLINTRKAIKEADDLVFETLSKKYGVKKIKLANEFTKIKMGMGNIYSKDRSEWIRLISNRLKIDIKEEDIKSSSELFHNYILNNTEVDKDAERVLTYIKSGGKKLGLLTTRDTKKNFKMRRINQTSFYRLFDAMLIAEEGNTTTKNDASAFIKIAKMLKEVPSNILMIGDDPTADIGNAKMAGMHTALLDKYTPISPIDHNPDVVIKELTDLLVLL